MVGTVLAGTSAVAVAVAGYQTMAPTGQCYGRTFIGLPHGPKLLALTYDDGPNHPHTLRLLEVLARHGVPATFFLIGRYVQLRPEIAREIAKAGHAIGNHSFAHPLLIFKTAAEIRKEISLCDAALNDRIGEHSHLFRPPFGGRRPAVFRIARELGLEAIMWNVTGYDWNAPPAVRIVKRLSANTRGGDVILLHDGSHLGMGGDRTQTVVATDLLLERWKPQGYDFVSIREMMKNQSEERAA